MAASCREARELLLLAHSENFLDDEEFLLLYDINSSKNPDFPYWQYDTFDLENLTEAECWAEFRFSFCIPHQRHTKNKQ